MIKVYLWNNAGHDIPSQAHGRRVLDRQAVCTSAGGNLFPTYDLLTWSLIHPRFIIHILSCTHLFLNKIDQGTWHYGVTEESDPLAPPDNRNHKTPSQRLTKTLFFPPLQPTEPFSSTHILAGGCPALYSTSSEDDIVQECVRAKNKGCASCKLQVPPRQQLSSPRVLIMRRWWKWRPTWQQPPSSNRSL